ncbi:MAG: hypothetical protein ABMA01_13450 [Chthoniobacteraceae bacterium]
MLWAARSDGRKAARRFPLLTVSSEAIRALSAAREAFDKFKGGRRDDTLPLSGHKPLFHSFATEYLAMTSTRNSQPGTLENETLLKNAHSIFPEFISRRRGSNTPTGAGTIGTITSG